MLLAKSRAAVQVCVPDKKIACLQMVGETPWPSRTVEVTTRAPAKTLTRCVASTMTLVRDWDVELKAIRIVGASVEDQEIACVPRCVDRE